MRLYFNINFHTKIGEKLQLLVLEDGQEPKIHFLEYSNHGNWTCEVDYFSKSITYKYQLTDLSGKILDQEYAPHHLSLSNSYTEFKIFDSWNLKNFPENYLNNKILKNHHPNFKAGKVSVLKKHSHHFRLEAPLYNPHWHVVILGNCEALGNWDYDKAVKMKQTDYGVWEAAVTLVETNIIQYKYGIYDEVNQQVIDMEYGDNRWLLPNTDEQIISIKADHFFKYKSYELYHAAGVAVPVFSLRTEQSFGVGEFLDIKKMADWAKKTNLGVIQILPINDTTANQSWEDSYPYAAISVYALHPQYLSIEALKYDLNKTDKQKYEELKTELNTLRLVDYEKMMAAKWRFIKVLFKENKEAILKDRNFKKFIKEHESWLMPYAAFCVLRDKYNTPNFNEWKTHKKFIAGKIAPVFKAKHKDYDEAMMHCWVQYELDKQLIEAIQYAHKMGVSIKGDLPIGIYRHSVEAWTEPELFGMDFQAGAPPDQFTDLGQNWGFPTYNWEVMKADGYQWWSKRFQALERYFDAMRIDHILGFFRIWKMPLSATQGILGYFSPAIPVTMEEFKSRYIPFDYDRYCKPFINEQILWEMFGYEREAIAAEFMNNHFNGSYSFREEFDTQRKLQDYFKNNPHPWAQEKLISLCANVLFIPEEKAGETVYHPRFNLHKTTSFQHLMDWEKQAIYEVYVDYFYRRQEGLWYQSAMEKLPALLNSTDMLICGEDLGLVPDCVPDVMDRLGITALKVQRMPADNKPWYNPKEASYLNVVTSSSHDSSTLRQWWHEDRTLIQEYFNHQLHQFGTAPWDLEPGIAEVIMKQHLYNDAMLSIFPIQEFFATDSRLMNPNIDEERINNPAVFPHYWRYRIHLNLEDLLEEDEFNHKIATWIQDCGRA